MITRQKLRWSEEVTWKSKVAPRWVSYMAQTGFAFPWLLLKFYCWQWLRESVSSDSKKNTRWIFPRQQKIKRQKFLFSICIFNRKCLFFKRGQIRGWISRKMLIERQPCRLPVDLEESEAQAVGEKTFVGVTRETSSNAASTSEVKFSTTLPAWRSHIRTDVRLVRTLAMTVIFKKTLA